MSFQFLSFEPDTDGLALITIRRPEKLNALNQALIFELGEAFRMAREDGFLGTDESSLVERLEQVEVSVVQGSDRNIKITKPTDMELARLFLDEETAGKPA